MIAAVDNFDLSGLSDAVSRIEHETSWNDVDQQIDECGYDDDEYEEDDVECHNGGDDDELEESAYTVGPPTDVPEDLEQFDGNLEDADASASQVFASASCSFQEARELLSRVKRSRGYFLCVGIGAFDGLAQPSTDCKVLGQGQEGQEERNDLFIQGWTVFKSWFYCSLAKATDFTLRISSTDVPGASDRNWHNSRWTTSRSSAMSWTVHVVSPSWASCI